MRSYSCFGMLQRVTFTHSVSAKQPKKNPPAPLSVCTAGYKARNKAGSPFKDLLIDANSVRQIPLRAFKVTGKEVRAYLA